MMKRMSQRENISIGGATPPEQHGGGGKSPLRATLIRPDNGATARRPIVVINRGLASGEGDNDALDALSAALAAAGVIAVLAEPRTANLILDDFNGFRLSDEVDDLLAVAQHAGQLGDADPARLGLIGWSLGAVAVLLAAARLPAVQRVCLINPATPAHIITRLARREALTGGNEPIPMAFVASLADLDAETLAAGHHAATLIVHAAADRFIPPAVSLEYLGGSEAAKRSVERVLIARADHAFSDSPARQVCAERVATFFSRAAAPSKSPRAAVGVQL